MGSFPQSPAAFGSAFGMAPYLSEAALVCAPVLESACMPPLAVAGFSPFGGGVRPERMAAACACAAELMACLACDIA